MCYGLFKYQFCIYNDILFDFRLVILKNYRKLYLLKVDYLYYFVLDIEKDDFEKMFGDV